MKLYPNNQKPKNVCVCVYIYITNAYKFRIVGLANHRKNTVLRKLRGEAQLIGLEVLQDRMFAPAEDKRTAFHQSPHMWNKSAPASEVIRLSDRSSTILKGKYLVL